MKKLSEQPILCIAGPTAVGKTRLALALAEQLPIEIISVDSAKIYRDMDIGTAKPSAGQLAQAPHHLINVCDPTESFSAGQFVEHCVQLIDDIQQRGNHPVLVGGTMLYFHTLQQGIASLPRGDDKIRAQINAQAQHQGWPALWAELSQVDPSSAAKINSTDSQRISRALEVYQISGVPLSELIVDTQPVLDVPWLQCQLVVPDRAELHATIAKRFQRMLDQGLIDEAKGLYERGDLSPELPSMRCVGYRQIWAYLAGEINREAMVDQAVAATRQLAKRQITWLRRWPEAGILSGDLSAQLLQCKQLLTQ